MAAALQLRRHNTGFESIGSWAIFAHNGALVGGTIAYLATTIVSRSAHVPSLISLNTFSCQPISIWVNASENRAPNTQAALGKALASAAQISNPLDVDKRTSHLIMQLAADMQQQLQTYYTGLRTLVGITAFFTGSLSILAAWSLTFVLRLRKRKLTMARGRRHQS